VSDDDEDDEADDAFAGADDDGPASKRIKMETDDDKTSDD